MNRTMCTRPAIAAPRRRSIGPAQRLYCAAFVHGAIAFGDFGKRRFAGENLAWVDDAIEYLVHQVGQEAADCARPPSTNLAARAGTVLRQLVQASAPGSGHQLLRIAFPLNFDRRSGILDLGKVRGRQGDVDCSEILF